MNNHYLVLKKYRKIEITKSHILFPIEISMISYQQKN